jgi:enediyne polyketide synthase
MRTAALARPDGSVDVVLRSDADAFATDRFQGRVVPAAQQPSAGPALRPPHERTEPHPFYDGPLFHKGRFQRLVSYERLTAFRVHAWIDATEQAGVFSSFHDPELLLGDPTAFDAALHVLLPCVPHRLALPSGAERFTVWQRPDGPMLVRAVERWHGDGEYRFDIDLVVPDGTVAARWEGLYLRATGPDRTDLDLPVELVGPWLSRRLLETGLAGVVDLATPKIDGTVLSVVDGDPRAMRVAAAHRLLGGQSEPGRSTDDGLLEFTRNGRSSVTAVRRVAGQDVLVALLVEEES